MVLKGNTYSPGQILLPTSSLLLLNCACRNGCFQLCKIWRQLLQQKLCWKTGGNASAKAGGLLCVWWLLHSPHHQHPAASILQGLLHHSLNFGTMNLWVFLPKVLHPFTFISIADKNTQYCWLFFLSENPYVKYLFTDNDPWDWPHVRNTSLPVVELCHAGLQPPGGVWS